MERETEQHGKKTKNPDDLHGTFDLTGPLES